MDALRCNCNPDVLTHELISYTILSDTFLTTSFPENCAYTHFTSHEYSPVKFQAYPVA